MFKKALGISILGMVAALPCMVLGESIQTLSQIPGVAGSTVSLGTYVNALFRIAIGLGAVIAVLMIVIGGFEYLSTDMFQRKSAGKERIQNSLLGLGLLLISTLLLQTINPKLLDLSFQPLKAEIEFTSMSAPGVYTATTHCRYAEVPSEIGMIASRGLCYETLADCQASIAEIEAREENTFNRYCEAQEVQVQFDGCQNCLTMDSMRERGIARTPGACQTGGGARTCLVPNANGIADTLLTIQDSGLIEQVTITEAWPPSPVHENGCHGEGTCLDFDINPAGANAIITVIDIARGRGNTAVWEVKTQPERDAIMRRLTPEQRQYYGRWICVEPHIRGNPGDHFSLYSNHRDGCNAGSGR